MTPFYTTGVHVASVTASAPPIICIPTFFTESSTFAVVLLGKALEIKPCKPGRSSLLYVDRK